MHTYSDILMSLIRRSWGVHIDPSLIKVIHCDQREHYLTSHREAIKDNKWLYLLWPNATRVDQRGQHLGNIIDLKEQMQV